MNPEQAREILSHFRPGTEDERDPAFVEALQLAERDPELASWLRERQVFDAAVSRKLQAASLPPDLLANVRAGVAKRRSRQRRRNFLLAAAACLILSATVAVFWMSDSSHRQATRFAECRRDMVQYLEQLPHLDLATESLAEARQWLANTRHLQQVDVPAGLQRFPTIGCRTLDWHGHKLALVCFMVDGEVVHFIVIPRSAIPDGPTGTQPKFARVSGTSTVAWSKGGLTYLVLSKANEQFLRTRL